jgi:tRNA isopentenyl-2-thiomethyl-A-37 hydroxylase MiaE
MNTIKTLEPELLVDSHHGIYIAQSFCQRYAAYITNMDKVKADFDICLLGPDNDEYWDAWADLMDNVEFTNDHGEKFTVGNLGEEGDLWAIPEGYEFPEDY